MSRIEDEPVAKKPRLDQMGGMIFPGMPPPMIMPGMAPVVPGMVPPGMMPGPSGFIPPAGLGQAPPRPLFPGALAPTSAPAPITSQPPPPSSVITSSGPRPVFPAYQQQPPSGNPAGVDGRPSAMVPTLPEVSRRPAEKVPSVGPGCKLIHPEDDLSLEEVRSQLPKYRTAKGPVTIQAPPSAPPHNSVPISGHPGNPTIAAMPIIRPGMGPPGMPMHQPPGMPPPNFQHPHGSFPGGHPMPVGQIRPYM